MNISTEGNQLVKLISEPVRTSSPAVAILWRRIFGQVKKIIGLRDMVVMLTDHQVYVSGVEAYLNYFTLLDLPSTPKAIFGDASSNVFYVATSSDLYTFNPKSDPYLDSPDCLSCGAESYPTVTFVGKLVFVSYDNFNVAAKMRCLFDLTENIDLETTYHLANDLDEPASKKLKGKSGQPLASVTRLSVPLGDIDVITLE